MRPLRYAFAPMEGITGKIFREIHAAHFPGIDRYCLPFFSPTEIHVLTPRQKRELEPGPLSCARLLPQLLTKSADDFLWCASAIADLGYGEINLNLGCPSGTVVSKGKGAGMLRDPDALDRFLDAVFSRCPIPISVKTRIGLEEPAEFPAILAVLNRYPICELTVHPRTRRELYAGPVHTEAIAEAVRTAAAPLCCNGNLFTPSCVQSVTEAFPTVGGVMLGRGLLADPALAVRCKGGERTRADLLAFHNDLCAAYLTAMHPNQAVLPKLKELWAYLRLLFPEDGSWKQMKKCKTWAEFYPITQELLQNRPLLAEADFLRIDQTEAAVCTENHSR